MRRLEGPFTLRDGAKSAPPQGERKELRIISLPVNAQLIHRILRHGEWHLQLSPTRATTHDVHDYHKQSNRRRLVQQLSEF